MGPLYDVCVIQGTRSNPSMTEAIIMGMKVEPRIMDTSQSNRGTQGHHLPYPLSHVRVRGLSEGSDSQERVLC